MVAVPYLAAFNLTRELLGAMRERGTGHIVNVTSVASRLVWSNAAAYIASRWAMEGFTRALRAELWGPGIGVTLAMFGTVDSPYWEHNPGSRDRLPKPARRIHALTPQEAASAVVAAIERGRRLVVRPRVYRGLFLLNALFPALTQAAMRPRA